MTMDKIKDTYSVSACSNVVNVNGDMVHGLLEKALFLVVHAWYDDVCKSTQR